MQGNQKVGARRSFSVTSRQETKSNDSYRGGNGRKNDNTKKILLKKPGVVFLVSRDMFLCLIVGFQKCECDR